MINSKEKKNCITDADRAEVIVEGVASKISADSHARRIRLRNTPGNAYADPSAHISGIVHSCPHLGYLNYICNAYRDAVGTEYVVDFAHAPRLQRQRRRRRHCRRRRRRGESTYAYVCSSVKCTSLCTHALSVNTHVNPPTRAVSRVYAAVDVRRRSLRTDALVLWDSRLACAPNCTRMCVRARECELVTTRCAS